eukprot:TRINITY_DN74504_c0_g1_i1.p1 TRINITY_DN74504_c0_g1~~TRINITY_DN74504_c0_g1_i1.p1  ORF type:complete len:181 (-),score=56.85 TRINITY_DN74504_c0_g1_i1:104-646(-)
MMNNLMAPQPKKSQKEIDDEAEAKRVMEEEKKKYDPPILRLRSEKSQLDTELLDEEELKVLGEVGRKGYYHARPKTIEAPPPQRVESAEAAEFKKVSFSNPRKRAPLLLRKADAPPAASTVAEKPAPAPAPAAASAAAAARAPATAPAPAHGAGAGDAAPTAAAPTESGLGVLSCCRRRR